LSVGCRSVPGVTVDAGPEPWLADGGDPVVGYLSEVLSAVGGLAAGTGPVGDAVRVDRIHVLEKVKASVAAAQAAEIVQFARSQVASQRDAGVNYRRSGQGIAEQIGLATGNGPWHGARKLTLARDLIAELPQNFRLLAAGEIFGYVAQLVATETSHLDVETRRLVDQHLVTSGVDRLAPKAAAGLARRLAYAADPQSALKRARHARKDRRVSLRPAPDTMTWFSALLPVEQRRGLPGRADSAHRRPQSSRGCPQPRADHGRRHRRTPHRPGPCRWSAG
jgi:hypothetical protein